MSVTAKQLSKSGARGKELDAVVRDLLLVIDEQLQRSERSWGRNLIAHELPVVFAFPGLDKRGAQRIIYAAVVSSLEGRGFGVRLLLAPERTTIYIEWLTDLSQAEVEDMNRLVRRVRIPEEDLEAFLARASLEGGGAAGAGAPAGEKPRAPSPA